MEEAYLIVLKTHEYWRKKPEFVYSSGNVPSWLMIAVEEGQFAYEIGSVSGTAIAGDIVICPPKVEFRRTVIMPLSFHYFSFWLNGNSDEAVARTIDLLHRLYSFKYTANEQERLYNNYRQLSRMTRIQNAQRRLWTQHLINDIWLLFHMEADSLAQYGNLAEDRLMKEAKALIEHYAFREFRLQDIADFLHIHPAQLSRRFQYVFGLTPSSYLISIRMEKAKGLLVQSEFTIDHIARLCGYENGFYFSRVFTRYSKVNPSQYRKLNGGGSL